jgi:hypothetical protein
MPAIQPHIAKVYVRTKGWNVLADGLGMTYRQESFLSRQRSILESIEMPELVGIDAEILPIIRSVPEDTSWDAGCDLLQKRFYSKIQQQIAENGSTMFFDIEHMMKTEAAILVSEILHRREREVKETVLSSDGNFIRTMPLHLAYYGHRILTTMSIFSSLPVQRVSELESALSSLDLSIQISDSVEREAVVMSTNLRNHIFEGQLSIYLLSYVRQRYSEKNEAVSIMEINNEFAALGFQLSDVTLQVNEDHTRGHLIEVENGKYIPAVK